MIATANLTRRNWMTTLWITVLALVLLLGLVLAQPQSSAASAGAAPPDSGPSQPAALPPATTCELAWRVVESPAYPHCFHQGLNGVAAIAANDVWAVGYAYVDPCISGCGWTPDRVDALLLHWDGASWSVGGLGNGNVMWLTAVVAVSTNDVWAVGYSGYEIYSPEQPLTMHWDGTSWTVVPNPGGYGTLTGVAATTANDVWAVGDLGIMHWDGTSWSVVFSPPSSMLTGVAAVAADDVWAVGAIGMLHWDGISWSLVPTPGAGGLTGVAAVAANDVWAVGGDGAVHWDGTSWIPSPGARPLTAVAAVAANDVWAMGYQGTQHWDGVEWSMVSGPSGNGLAAVAANDAWVVGQSYPFSEIVHYSTDCLEVTPTPTPTITPTATATFTATPTRTPTNTATNTATPCPLNPNYGVAVTANQTMLPATSYVAGSRCSSCTIGVNLPFLYTLYDVAFSSVNAGSKGTLQFATSNTSGSNHCLPSSSFARAILPYWDSLDASLDPTMGTFTGLVGTAPNRIFVLKYRGGKRVGQTVSVYEYEVLLYEGQPRFDIIYGAVPERGSSATIGVQWGTGTFYTQFSCNTQSLQPGYRLRFDRSTCPLP